MWPEQSEHGELVRSARSIQREGPMTDTMLPEIEECVMRLSLGDDAAREKLLDLAHDRLVRSIRKMLRGFPGVRRWEETDEVWQNAGLRLWKSLADVRIENACHFFRLAGLQIRRELIELRCYHGLRQATGRAGFDSGCWAFFLVVCQTLILGLLFVVVRASRLQ